jgi:alanine or glycine:cation symporter, AGCS family
METLQWLVDTGNRWVWNTGITVGDETIPFVVMALLGTGFYLTLRLGFIQLRRLGHGFAVTSGRYDDPDEPGDVSHFQALSTALSATVGIGNIAGVAIAIHWGGPGAVFWMWMTAALGMAVKYTEVTLAQQYRQIEKPDLDPHRWEGSVSGGPMYYIERGMGRRWKPIAVFFAIMLGLTAFLTGNGIQANTVANSMETTFGVPTWVSGAVTATVVALVIVGGITRIGRVTGILAPLMAAIYVLGALIILAFNAGAVVPGIATIFREAFNPTAGVAGTGIGAVLVTMMWGVKRGLFSNEAGQGSAPIAHAAAKTDEPVSEGVVALVEPFIDTIVICSMTALVIIVTGAWDDRVPTAVTVGGGDMSYIAQHDDGRWRPAPMPSQVQVVGGTVLHPIDGGQPAWNDVVLEQLYVDPAHTQPFSGLLLPGQRVAVADDGTRYTTLHGPAVRNAAPLTMLAFQRGLGPLGDWGHFIVLLSVLLFAVSTAIAWSYYGDRCAHYLLGPKSVLPYKMVFVLMHFIGAVLPLPVVWDLGDLLLGIVIFPNLLALIVLSPQVARLTQSYFERRPWVENAEVQRRLVEQKRQGRPGGS